jgi:hypothetical protein
MSHDERIRLLYVACTRARDHLVVSLHRRARSRPATSLARCSNAEVLTEALGDELAELPDGVVGPFVVGTIAAAVSGLVAIWALLGYVRRRTYTVFVVYRLLAAGGVLLLIALGIREATF